MPRPSILSSLSGKTEDWDERAREQNAFIVLAGGSRRLSAAGSEDKTAPVSLIESHAFQRQAQGSNHAARRPTVRRPVSRPARDDESDDRENVTHGMREADVLRTRSVRFYCAVGGSV